LLNLFLAKEPLRAFPRRVASPEAGWDLAEGFGNVGWDGEVGIWRGPEDVEEI
jgi:hypothetical protein